MADVAPLAPLSPAATKVSDTQVTIAWTNDPASAPITGSSIDRWDNVSVTWERRATLAGSVASWSDTTIQPDRQYRWRVQNFSVAGTSAWSTTGDVVTSPAAHTLVTASRSGADITLSWKKNSSLAVSTVVESSTDGGTTWSAALTAVPGSLLALLPAPASTVTHSYRVSPAYSGVSGPWAYSNTVPVSVPPAEPTNLSPANNRYVASGAGIPLAWRYNSLDGSEQTAFEVQYLVSGGSWVTTGQTLSTGQTLALVAQPAGVSITWQVRTWGQHPDPSPWSSPVSVFNVGQAPAVAITSPATGGTVNTSVASVTFTYTGTSPQAGGTVRLYDASGTVLVGTAAFTGSGTTQPIPLTLQGATGYVVSVQAVDTTGLSSAAITSAFTTDFSAPPVPQVTLTGNDVDGSITVAIHNPAPGAGTAATHNMLFRQVDGSWELLNAALPINSAYIDLTAPTVGTITYRAVAVSAAPVYQTSGDISLTLSPERCAEYIWLSAGPGFSLVGRFRGNPKVSTTHTKDKVLRKFFNRPLPVQYVSAYTAHEIDFSGVIEETDPMSTEERMTAINDWEGLVLYRDAWGRRVFGSMAPVVFEQLPHDLQTFSSKVIRARTPGEVL